MVAITKRSSVFLSKSDTAVIGVDFRDYLIRRRAEGSEPTNCPIEELMAFHRVEYTLRAFGCTKLVRK